MKDHNGCVRGYFRTSKCWYAKTDDEIVVDFGMYHEDDQSTSGEMIMVWIEINGKLVPQLRCFDDGWSALSLFTDLIQKMGELDDENISEENFVNLLNECGFKDFTKYVNPYPYIDVVDSEKDIIEIKISKDRAKDLGLI